MRIILYTGKGGVGKTSIAAATACQLASQGKRVLIMSTDQAHSLSDSFDFKLRNEPTQIMENLDGIEIDAAQETERNWGKVKRYLLRLTAMSEFSGLDAEELLTFPGAEELFSMLRIKEIYEEDQYDVCIVDCAPTGETMQLLKFPEMFQWWMKKLFPMKRAMTKAVGPVIEKTTKIAMPDDEIFDEVEQLIGDLASLREIMGKKDVVSIRIVTTSEKIVIKEAKRNFSYLHLYNYNVDAVIVNKIYPEESMQGYFQRWEELQKKGLTDIQESFPMLPVFRLQLQPGELTTIPKLTDAAKQIYGDEDPSKVYFQEQCFWMEKEEDTTAFCVHLPFIRKEEVDAQQIGDELVLSIKNEHRRFMLPPKLVGKTILRADYKEDVLKFYF